MQPVRPLQVPGPQVGRLVLERGVGVQQPHRQRGLHGQHRQQRPGADHPPSPVAQPGYRVPSAGARRLRCHRVGRMGFGGISGPRLWRSGRGATVACN
jgi:hypothetical protein